MGGIRNPSEARTELRGDLLAAKNGEGDEGESGGEESGGEDKLKASATTQSVPKLTRVWQETAATSQAHTHSANSTEGKMMEAVAVGAQGFVYVYVCEGGKQNREKKPMREL